MRRHTTVFLLLGAFVVGAGVGLTVGKDKAEVSPAAWEGVSPQEAAANLLELSTALAGDGSWENINVARVYYLSGQQDKAKAVFDRYTTAAKPDPSDLIRIGRVYTQANEWDRAKPLFDQVVELAPKDEDWLIEIGSYYNLNGDRDRAEELFERGFSTAPRNLKNALNAAGSYIGVTPRLR